MWKKQKNTKGAKNGEQVKRWRRDTIKSHINRPSCFCSSGLATWKAPESDKKKRRTWKGFPSDCSALDNSSDVPEEDDVEDMTEETEDVNDGDD